MAAGRRSLCLLLTLFSVLRVIAKKVLPGDKPVCGVAMNAFPQPSPVIVEPYRSCRLCPRRCGVNRVVGERGVCGESAELRVAAVEAHYGEEPPISGVHGSGTVFFSGCSLRCAFCQNYQISLFHTGKVTTVPQLVDRLEELYRSPGIHNVNFVTPDHFLPHTVAVVEELHRRGLRLPILYNMSGYAEKDSLKMLQGVADIYLPDYKYADADLARALSHAPDYPQIALDALVEMVRQVGFLDERPIAERGVLVRHLVLPGHIQNSLDALTTLFLEFGRDLPISLMSQYWPARPVKQPEMNRRLARNEFETVCEHADALGFRRLFVQRTDGNDDDFLPDFRRERPFKGNIRNTDNKD